jgi:hypothetical protein
MSYDDPRGRERDPATPQEPKVERAALAFLIDKYPDRLTIPQVSRAMNAKPGGGSESGDGVERAIRELVGAGLLHCQGGYVLPTRAALYFERLEADG